MRERLLVVVAEKGREVHTSYMYYPVQMECIDLRYERRRVAQDPSNRECVRCEGVCGDTDIDTWE